MAAIARTKNSILVKKRNQIIEALAANPNPTQVARKMGVGSRLVYRIAKAEGIKLTTGLAVMGMPSRLSPDLRASIIVALQANPNATQVAREIGGVSKSAVWKIAKAEGIKLTSDSALRGRTLLSPDRRAAIIAALRANPNATQVAREIGGVGYGTVRKIAKAEGIKLTSGLGLRGKTLLSLDRRAAIIAALRANPHATQVAREIGGVNKTTVYRIAKAEGIKLTSGLALRGRTLLSLDRRAAIIAALRANPHATQVAREIGGVNKTTVYRIAKAEGIKLTSGLAARRRTLLSPDRRAAIIAALRANPNATQVAREIGGVNKVIVYRIAKAEGIKLTAGLELRGWPFRLSPDRRAAIIAALRANPHAKLVASEIGGVSYGTVRKIAKAEGIELTAGKATRGRSPRKG